MGQKRIPSTTGGRSVTYRQFGVGKLRALLDGLGLGEHTRTATRIFDALTDSYARLPLDATPLWPSDITDDGTPFEFSVAFSGGEPSVRILSEAQRPPFHEQSAWQAALAVNQRLRAIPGVDFGRFDRIAQLFEPRAGTPARFGLWHAGELRSDGSLAFKVYLNPRIAGNERAPELVREALACLDADYIWRNIAGRLNTRSELLYLSLDLAAGPDARVKLYLGHPGATSNEIDALTLNSPGYTPGRASTWIEALTGTAGPFDARPILTCHGFRSPAQRPDLTIHVPTRCYVDHDAEALVRASCLLGADRAVSFSAGVHAMAGRPLETGRSMISYVSLRPEGAAVRVTTYLALEAFAIAAPRASLLPMAGASCAPPSASLPPPHHSSIRDLSAQKPGASALANLADAEALIAEHVRTFSRHRFFSRLDGEGSLEQVRAIAPRLIFFVLSFQDVLRLTRVLSTDSQFEAFAKTHEAEDRGHDLWFLDDLRQLGVERDLNWAFSEEHAATRDIGYALVSLIITATHDATRLAVLLALEAAGAQFFGRIIGFLERIGQDAGLSYFARSHQHIEQNHDLFDARSHAKLGSLPVPPGAAEEVRRAVEKTFQEMARLGDEAEASVIALRATRAAATTQERLVG